MSLFTDTQWMPIHIQTSKRNFFLSIKIEKKDVLMILEATCFWRKILEWVSFFFGSFWLKVNWILFNFTVIKHSWIRRIKSMLFSFYRSLLYRNQNSRKRKKRKNSNKTRAQFMPTSKVNFCRSKFKHDEFLNKHS